MTNINEDPFLNPKKERLVQADGQNMYVPKAGFFDSENWSAGFGEGQTYTSYSLLSDLGLKFGDKSPLDTIDVNEWNESHPYFDEDVTWTDELTLDVARNIYFEKAEDIDYQKLQSRSTVGGMVARGAGIFGGAALDPINLIAAPASLYAKGTILGSNLLNKMVLAGAANFAVEGMLQGVAYGTQDVRGQKLGIDDVALNLGMAFGIGAAFPFAGAGLKGLYKITRGNRLPTDTKAEIKYTAEQKQKLNIKSGHSQTTKFNTIENTNFNTIDSLKIDTKGRIDTEGAGVTVTKNADNTVSVTGTASDLAQILPTLANKLDNFESINIKIDDAPVQAVTNADDIKAIAKQIEIETGVKGELDAPDVAMERIDFEGKNYEIEFDENGDLTGKVFRARKDGKRGKQLKEAEAKAIIEANQQSILHTRNKINQRVEPINQETNNRTNRAGNETVDSNINTKRNYSTQNQVEASTSGQSREFNENFGNTETANKAWTAESVVSSKNLFRAGYFIDENNELIDLTVTKVSDLTSKQRALLAKRLGVKRTEIPTDANGFAKPDATGQRLREMINDFDNDMKANNQHKDSLRDYVFCRLGAGTL